MLHILLLLLKVIGILLLIILGLLFLVMTLVLFVPIRYQICAEKEEPVSASVQVTWLLRLIHLQISFQQKILRYSIKLLGFTLFGTKPKDTAKDTAKETAMEETFKDESITQEPVIAEAVTDETENIDVNSKETDVQEAIVEEVVTEDVFDEKPLTEVVTNHASSKTDSDTKDHEHTKSSLLRKRIQKRSGSIHSIIKKIKDAITNIRTQKESMDKAMARLRQKVTIFYRFLTNQCTKSALSHIKRELCYLIRHFLPRKATGFVRFGFEDPAATGKILGYLSALSTITGQNLNIEADFEQKQWDGSIAVEGYIRICHAVKALLACFLDKNIRKTIKRIRKLKG